MAHESDDSRLPNSYCWVNDSGIFDLILTIS